MTIDAQSMNTPPAAGVLALSGPLTFASAAATLEAQRRQLAGGSVQVIDLAGVGECDSAGLACVLALLSEAQQRRGGDVQLIHVPAGLRALAEVADLGKLFG